LSYDDGHGGQSVHGKTTETDDDDDNSIQFFIFYVLSQQLQGQLQIQHSLDTSNYITEQYNIKSKTNYRQALEKIHINTET
jgi:hypothetical protein